MVLRPECVETFLERSGTLPLSVTLREPASTDANWEQSTQASSLIHLHKHRIRHLELQNPPVLPAFCIIDGECPPLESVTLSSYLFRWTDPVFCSSLKRLEISGLLNRGPSTTHVSLRDMFDAMRRMPQLEQLHLEQPIAAHDLPGFDTGGIVKFPKLQDISLVAVAQRCIFILDRIICPVETRFFLVCVGLEPREIPQLSSCLGNKVAAETVRTIWLDFGLVAESTMHVCGWNVLLSPEVLLAPTFPGLPSLNLLVSHELKGENAVRILCKSFPFSAARHVFVARITARYIPTLANLFYGEGDSIYPSVDTLVLKNANLIDSPSSIRYLVSSLAARSTLHKPIKRVVLLRCEGIRLDGLSALGSLTHVECQWDGHW